MIELKCRRCNETFRVQPEHIDDTNGLCSSCKLELMDKFRDEFYGKK